MRTIALIGNKGLPESGDSDREALERYGILQLYRWRVTPRMRPINADKAGKRSLAN